MATRENESQNDNLLVESFHLFELLEQFFRLPSPQPSSSLSLILMMEAKQKRKWSTTGVGETSNVQIKSIHRLEINSGNSFSMHRSGHSMNLKFFACETQYATAICCAISISISYIIHAAVYCSNSMLRDAFEIDVPTNYREQHKSR